MTIPFVVGQWVKGERFYGREPLLQEVLEGNRSWVWLLGTRRVGKTSLLKQLEHVTSSAPERGYLPVFFDFQGAATPEELHQYFGDALLDSEERLARVGIGLSDVQGDDLFSTLERLRRRLRSTGLKLLLLCDEVEELIKLNQADPALLSKLRRALQSREDVRSVLASTIRLWALAEQKGDTSPFLHGFTPPLYIRSLSDEEARSLIRQDKLPSELRPGFAAEVVESIRSRCDDHPYLIQLVCKRFVEAGDLEEALEQVATDEMVSHFFSVDFEILSEEERNVLRVIGRQTAATSDSIQAHLVVEPTSLSGALHRLEQLGFIRRNQERRFVLANSFFRRWLGDEASRKRLPVVAAGLGTTETADRFGSSGIVDRPGGLIGSSLLHYRIVRRLGEGGMGEVYGAEDAKLGREVALKLLPPEMAADPDRRERFRREARALAALNHPNIVTIYALEAVGGVHFMATELVAGKTLGDLIAERLPLDTILDLTLPLVEALAAAHARGIVHRDLKPANIIVAEGARVKLLDFGVAVFRETPGVVDTHTDTRVRTAPGMLVGTIPYMSPEQIQGRRVDHRTDLFSLGVILYEALTGDRPFQGRSAGELLSAILRDDPAPLGTIRPDLPPQLVSIVGRCLEKDPEARYASAEHLYQALEALKRDREAKGSSSRGLVISPDFPFESRFTEVLGSRIHYVDVGQGDPILFLHGNPTSSYLWRNVIPHLSGSARCIAPDLIGMGRSDKPDIDYRFVDHSRYVEGFVEALGLQNLTLVIHDWGSALGFHYAMRHEANVRGLAFMEAILGPASWSDFPPGFRTGFRLFRTPGIGWLLICGMNVFVNRILPKAIVRKLSPQEHDRYREPFPSARSRKPVWRWPNEIPIDGHPADVVKIVESYRARLLQSPLPKLLFHAAPGGLVTEKTVRWCREKLQNLETADLGAGIHYLQEDNPHGIGSRLAAWYARLPRSR